jgi:hypothetical protein
MLRTQRNVHVLNPAPEAQWATVIGRILAVSLQPTYYPEFLPRAGASLAWHVVGVTEARECDNRIYALRRPGP